MQKRGLILALAISNFKIDTLVVTVPGVWCKRVSAGTGLVVTGVTLTCEKLGIANVQHGKNCVRSPAVVTPIVRVVTSIPRKKRADHRATVSVKTSMRTQTSNELRPVALYSVASMACVLDQCLWVSWTSSRRHQHPFTWMRWGKEGGGGMGILRCLDPRQVLYKPSLLGAKNEKTKRILMCEVTVFCVL